MSEKNQWLSVFINPLRKQAWFEAFRQAFWSNPDRLMAAKATFAIALLAVPFVVAGKSVIGITLALGALAGALSETDDHPRGRIKSLALKVVSFGFSSFAVALLNPYPIILGFGLAISTIGFILIGGLSERYRGVTFGAILVGIYTMLGIDNSPGWYLQPILLSAGALFYGLLSLVLLFYHPWRLLEEQLARGYLALATYLEEKAKLFPSDKTRQGQLRNQLALQNVQLVAALDRCKDVLNSYGDAVKDEEPLKPYMRYFMLLQSLHERAASSHERYDLLSDDPENKELLEGIGQTLLQLSLAIKQFANSLLTGTPYRHPISLAWMVNALKDQFEKAENKATHPLAPLINNLNRSHQSLANLNEDQQRSLTPRLAKDERKIGERLKAQLNWNHPRLRYAIRLSLCFLIGFAISEGFQIARGEWIILTSLFVCQPSYSETRRRLLQRVLGTLTGVIAGVLIVQLFPTSAGQLVLMLASAFTFLFWLRRNYSISVIFITIFVLSAFSLITDEGVAIMVPRLVDTVIGSVLAIISVRLLWPDWQYKRLPGLIKEALSKNTAYFQAIINEYEHESTDDDFDYRVARRQAHRADNALVLAWQGMQMEPKNRQHFRKQAFTLTYLNHALLSYLSALGAHRQQQQLSTIELLSIAKDVLAALQEVTNSMQVQNGMDDKHIDNLMHEIKEHLNNTEQGEAQQQFNLLFNIADVTAHILKRANVLAIHQK
jgi:uncharacterized membrane protein (TIGR01666 family)